LEGTDRPASPGLAKALERSAHDLVLFAKVHRRLLRPGGSSQAEARRIGYAASWRRPMAASGRAQHGRHDRDLAAPFPVVVTVVSEINSLHPVADEHHEGR
jgi:hypothetical protein